MRRLLISICLFSLCCSSNSKVEKGDEVFLTFKLFNEEGTTIDGSYLPTGLQQLRIVADQGFLFHEFDSLLLGMCENEQKTAKVPLSNNYSENGVFYRNSISDSVFLIKPGEILTLQIDILKINKRE